MALTAGMVASEILMCGVKAGIKQIPIVGEMAVHVVEGLQKRHEALNNATRMAEIEAQLSRVERGMRDTVEKEIRTILANLGHPALPGPELTREMTELRQIYEQGWVPNLFEGILRNSSHWQELRRNPKQYGRMLGDHDPVDPENGMHLLIDKDKTRILELPASSLAFLLSNQSVGIPAAEVRAAQEIWAFPAQTDAPRRGKTADLGIVLPSGRERQHGASGPRGSVLLPTDSESRSPLAVPLRAFARFENSLGMTMIRIEPGRFTMGSSEWGGGPPHEVRITRPFFLSAHPVTQGQYRRHMRKTEHYWEEGRDDLPVAGASWNDAIEFCNRLAESDGREYRLPTEAEWEYACRAGTSTRFFFGDNEVDLGRYAWFNGNANQKTHPVGRKKPNPWGFFDMLGNVPEWCQDLYLWEYYKNSPRDDPAGPEEAVIRNQPGYDRQTGCSRVLRGGSFELGPEECHPAYRCCDSQWQLHGFRVVADVDE
jgi:formylglycine-generating enzyme required for sulfatase activity